MLPLLAQSDKTYWMPKQASTYAGAVDWVFYFTYWSSAIAFILIMIAMVVMVIRYRRRPGHKTQPSPAHSTAMELTWTLIPSVIFVMIFYWGFKGFLDIATTPDYAYEIQVTAKKWNWTFQYPNGAESDELHIPVGRPIRLILQSQDVIHSVFVPAFRMKKDAVPGRYNTVWVEATMEGEFDLYCAEYCGTNHSTMITKAVVQNQGDFDEWLIKASEWVSKETPVNAGKLLYQKKGCNQCHSIDGSRITGPSFKDIFRKSGRVLKSGETMVADENYIRHSIVDPGADVVATYDNVMPPIRMTDQEITAIIQWMKTISIDATAPLEAWPAEVNEGETKEGEAAPGASPATSPAVTPVPAAQ